MGISQWRQVAYMLYMHICMTIRSATTGRLQYMKQAANAYKAQPQGAMGTYDCHCMRRSATNFIQLAGVCVSHGNAISIHSCSHV